MFDQKVLLPEQLPIREKERKSTDVCCTIIGAILALTMFIVACCMWNRGNFDSLYGTAPTGKDGKGCADGSFSYVSDPNDYETRSCVAKCPTGFTGTSKGICLPDDQGQRAKYMANPSISRGYDHSGFKRTILCAFIMAIACGLIRIALTFFFPRFMPIISFILAILLLIAFGVLALVLPGLKAALGGWAVPLAVVCFILAIIFIVMLCVYANQVKFQGFMLEYSNRFLSENSHSFAYIPVFIILHIGLVALIIWQHACFSSNSQGSNNFWKMNSSGFWDILNILEYLWGLQFLRDAFNFCVSGNAVDWYWTRQSSCYQPYQRLLCKNWGSVVGGSFLNAFFQVPTLLIELLVCHPNTCCSKMGTICYNSCNILTCFFDLVRTDAYSYINLTGIPFCNAARQCRKLCDRSNQFVGYHSPMKHYRLVAHIACIAFVFLLTWFILKYRVANISLWHVAILIMVIYGTVTWFIGIHVDSAQGLQTSYLAQHQLQGEHQYMQKLLPSMRKILQPHQNRVLRDGNC